MSVSISPQEVVNALSSGAPIALVDVREEAAYSIRHILFAATLPLARLEVMLPDRVPQRGCRLIICDGDGESEAVEALRRVRDWGYGESALLKGGIHGWAAAGYPLYGGMNSASKAFGEAVETRLHTPKIGVDELHAMRVRKLPHVLIDCRPTEEYLKQSLPGSINIPGVELTYRIDQVVTDPTIPVIVHCAGRTRSIMGAQTLIESRLPNPVCSLENGTMGWLLAGHDAAPGTEVPELDARGEPSARALKYAQRVAEAHDVTSVDEETVHRWLGGRDELVTCMVDVRTPAEYRVGHLNGAIHAPGGQLVQATDKYLAIQNARIVLVDDDGVRARITGGWLKRMGWAQVHVLAMHECKSALVSGGEPRRYFFPTGTRTRWISAAALRALLEKESAHVVDLDTSIEYEASHIVGARFVKRASLGRMLSSMNDGRQIVLSSSDGIIARIAAAELGRQSSVRVLEGGKQAAKLAGIPFSRGPEHMLDAGDEMWRRPLDIAGDPTPHMRNYLQWEIGLVNQIERDETVRFSV